MKEKIYILHGWSINPDNEKKWEGFRSQLSALGIESVFLPIPGLTTPLSEVWTLPDYVTWLKETLEKALVTQHNKKSEKIILLGHSFGGQIASVFASQHPEYIDKLILIDSSGIIDTRMSKKVKRFVFKALATVGKLVATSEFLRTILYKLARESDYLRADKTQRQTMANVLSYEVTTHLEKIKATTLIIWGERDRATPAFFADIFAKKIEGSQLHIVSDAAHSPQFTHSKQTATLIGEFLK